MAVLASIRTLPSAEVGEAAGVEEVEEVAGDEEVEEAVEVEDFEEVAGDEEVEEVVEVEVAALRSQEDKNVSFFLSNFKEYAVLFSTHSSNASKSSLSSVLIYWRMNAIASSSDSISRT